MNSHPVPLPRGRGRPKGALNKATKDIQAFTRGLLEDKAYQRSLQQRLNDGKLAPAVQCLLYHYAYGKPREQLELSGQVNLPVRVVHEYHDASDDAASH